VQIPTEPPFSLNGWTYRFRPARAAPARLLVMLHGWTGDENSMWFFAHNMPASYSVLMPRAPHTAPEGGYSWREVLPGSWGFPTLDDLRPAAEALIGFLDAWSASSGAPAAVFDVAGFSQGAALAYTLGVLFPERAARLAALAGFLPAGSEVRLGTLKGKQVFLSHGRSDEIVPVEQARAASRLLSQAGVNVDYCETDGGHKVGKECLKGMVFFFENSYNPLSTSRGEDR
jgi:phospholipase/carboxylesterase